MSSSKQHSDQFYNKLLDQYIQGEISHADLHLLEKQALDDPFLADALEGYYYADHQLSRKHLKNLQLRVPQKKLMVRRFPFWKISAVAASLLFVVSIGFLLKDSNTASLRSNDMASVDSSKKQSSPIVKIESKENYSAKKSTSNATTFSNNSVENISTGKPVQVNIEENSESFDVSQKDQKELSILENFQNGKFETTEESDNIVVEAERQESQQEQLEVGVPQAEMDSPDDAMEDEEIAMDNSESMESEPIKIRGQSSSQGYVVDGIKLKKSDAKNSVVLANDQISNSLQGTITDGHGLALIGANVMAFSNGDLISTSITNIDGEYTMDSLVVSKLDLEVSYVGYSDARLSDIKLDLGVNTQDVILNETQVLNEVVVTEISIEKNTDFYAEPIHGYDAFRAYIQEEKNDSKTKTSTDYVVLSFRILIDGSLDQIKVLDTNNKDRVEEAKQLLRKGGPWRVKKPKNAPYTTTYRVEF